MPGGLVEYRSGPAAHAINRRRMGWRISPRHLPRPAALRAPDPTGPRDETVHVLTFTDERKRPVAPLWSYACHPVTFAEPGQVSADYPGVVRRALRAAFGADLPVLFLQGCAGDIRPRELGRPRTLGRRLAELVVGKLFTPFTAPEYVAWSGSLATRGVEVARGRATSYPLAPAAAGTRLRLSAPLAGASAGGAWRFTSRQLNRGWFQAGEPVRPLQRRALAMRTLYPVALAALVVSCHLDKLLNGGGGNGPPSEAAPARVAFSSSLGNARAGQPISPPVQVTVQDSAGRVTLRDTLVTLSLAANPSGDSLRGKKQVRSVNGVATFAHLRLDKADSRYTLTAAAPNLHPDTSAAFSVMPAPATVLAFTGPPSVTMQDSAMKPVQVTAYDSLGNTATNFAGSIQLRIGTDGSISKKATLSGAVAQAVAGVATFPNLRIDSVGTGYTLTAAFGSAAPVDTSVPFDITQGPPPPPPPPTHLRFTQQPQQTTEAGATITPPVQVAAFDASDHVVQGFTGAIGLALEPASNGGTPSGGAPGNAGHGAAPLPSLSA